MVRINKYIILIIYINKVLNNNISKIIYFIIKIYLIKNLKTNILIENNILIS